MKKRLIATSKVQELEKFRSRESVHRARFEGHAGSWVGIKNAAGGSELFLYGDLAWYEITSADVASALAEIGPDKTVSVRINSGGGDVFEGIAIYNLLMERPGRVEVYVDALAASIASVVAMAGDEIIMAKNALMMIHKPWAMVIGTDDDMRDMAQLLRVVEDRQIVPAYQDHTNISVSELKKMMAAETWLDAQEAVDNKFADRVGAENKVEALARPEMYAHAPKAIAKNGSASISESARQRMLRRQRELDLEFNQRLHWC